MRRQQVAKSALAGLAGGLIASFVMNQFQAVLAKVQNGDEENKKKPEADEEPATVKVANVVSERVRARPLQPDEKEPAGNAVHYLFGGVTGGCYGALAQTTPATQTGFGTLFGSVLWFAADEVAVPRLGLSKSPKEYPASTHASALASHLIYGITTDLVRRGLLAL